MHFSAKLATFIETRKLLGTYHHTELLYYVFLSIHYVDTFCGSLQLLS